MLEIRFTKRVGPLYAGQSVGAVKRVTGAEVVHEITEGTGRLLRALS